MPATDFHHHLWPDRFRRRLERRSAPPFLRGTRLTLPYGGAFDVDPAAYAPEARLAELDRAGLQRAVVSLPPTTEPTPDLVETWHEETLELQAATGGRIVPLAYATADPRFAGAIVPAPLLGDAQQLLTRLAHRHQLAFVHPAPAAPSSPGWITGAVGYAQQMLEAYAYWLADGARRWPTLPVVFGLLAGGAAFQLERLLRRGLDPQTIHEGNVWFETSSYGERALELSLQTFGADRHVFGSDAPIDPLPSALAATRAFGGAVETALLVDAPLGLLAPARTRWAA